MVLLDFDFYVYESDAWKLTLNGSIKTWTTKDVMGSVLWTETEATYNHNNSFWKPVIVFVISQGDSQITILAFNKARSFKCRLKSIVNVGRDLKNVLARSNLQNMGLLLFPYGAQFVGPLIWKLWAALCSSWASSHVLSFLFRSKKKKKKRTFVLFCLLYQNQQQQKKDPQQNAFELLLFFIC